MDPNSGRIISGVDLNTLKRTDPDEAAKFSVLLEGKQEEIEKIAAAVQREANRRKNKAARQARRTQR